MKNYIFLFLILCIAMSSSAQEALQAFAQKDDTYLLFSDKGYDKQKKYVLFNFWNASTPNADLHNTEFNTLKTSFAGVDNFEFVNIEWKTENDLQVALGTYKIESTLEFGKHIRLKGDHFTVNTSSPNAFFLIENNNAAFLCSGSICGKKLRAFFHP